MDRITIISASIKYKSSTTILFKYSLTIDLDVKYINIYLIKFRISNHKLPIKTGRWKNILEKIECCLCKKIWGWISLYNEV